MKLWSARKRTAKNRIRDLFNISYPVQQSDTAICVDIIVAIERCADDTRRDGVDPDIVGRKFRRKTNGERMHAALGDQRRRGGKARHRMIDQHRADVDDRAAALLLHLAYGCLRGEVGALEVTVDVSVEVGFGNIDERFGAKRPGIVDEHINTAEAVHCHAHQCLPGFRAAYIPWNDRNLEGISGLSSFSAAA